MDGSQRTLPDARDHVSSDMASTKPLDFRRLGFAKSAFTTRFVFRLIAEAQVVTDS